MLYNKGILGEKEGEEMPFMKLVRVRKQYKGFGHKKGDILLMEDELIDDIYRKDDEGNKYFDEDVKELTEEEAAKCLRVETIEI